MRENRAVIYLDNNATTRIDERVLEAIIPFYTEYYANANSKHRFGEDAYIAVKNSRQKVADLIGAMPNEIIFTSGSTEAINIAIKGIAENYSIKGKHIITTSTEHLAVLDTCKFLEKFGHEITYLPVEQDGLISIEKFESLLRCDTALVSIMYVNNETGVIQPIKEISTLTHKYGAFFMTDATQAVGKMQINVEDLGIDMLSMSGHKIYGPKGIGALYVSQKFKKIQLSAQVHGGGHEKGIRSGTLNVPGIVGLGRACEIAKEEMRNTAKRIKILRDYLEVELLKINGSKVNGNSKKRIYNTSNILFPNIDSDALIMALGNFDKELPLVAVSNGSACTSASIEPSHVLMAMGLNEAAAFSSIRFSLGKYNTMEEIYEVIEIVKECIRRLKISVN